MLPLMQAVKKVAPKKGQELVALISQKVFMKSSYKSQFLNKSVNVFIIITNMKNELTDLWGH